MFAAFGHLTAFVGSAGKHCVATLALRQALRFALSLGRWIAGFLMIKF